MPEMSQAVKKPMSAIKNGIGGKENAGHGERHRHNACREKEHKGNLGNDEDEERGAGEDGLHQSGIAGHIGGGEGRHNEAEHHP